jgi:hypothetical protein
MSQKENIESWKRAEYLKIRKIKNSQQQSQISLGRKLVERCYRIS